MIRTGSPNRSPLFELTAVPSSDIFWLVVTVEMPNFFHMLEACMFVTCYIFCHTGAGIVGVSV